MARLSDPVTSLKGVGPARAKQLENLNIVTLGDLICHFPRGYEDRTRESRIADLMVVTDPFLISASIPFKTTRSLKDFLRL